MSSNLFIIGSPRSGTNIIRDVLCRNKNISTWPCDEINYIWRHLNLYKHTDYLTELDASPRVKTYLRSVFHELGSSSLFNQSLQYQLIVEKTCANTLRIPFVNEVFPGSLYLYIKRNPFDVVTSSLKRWTAPLDLSYLRKKAKYVPFADLPFYSTRYLSHRLRRYFSRDNALPVWGPLPPELNTFRPDHPLYSQYLKCFYQWYFCCFHAEFNLSRLIPPHRLFTVYYEDLVSNPDLIVNRILDFLSYPISLRPDISCRDLFFTSSVCYGKTLPNELIEILSSLYSNLTSSHPHALLPAKLPHYQEAL